MRTAPARSFDARAGELVDPTGGGVARFGGDDGPQRQDGVAQQHVEVGVLIDVRALTAAVRPHRLPGLGRYVLADGEDGEL
ncbi:hypothetical protein ACIGXI_19620 [Kitasatospora aureofaciens]|uniref:hypothetical protein n=1 Tax=Kitasatospora aureofaciens TaxID=1894 RepID=UPI0037C9AE41